MPGKNIQKTVRSIHNYMHTKIIFFPTDTRVARLCKLFTLKKTTNYVKIVLAVQKKG